jgi:hypothetical protein
MGIAPTRVEAIRGKWHRAPIRRAHTITDLIPTQARYSEEGVKG